MRMRFILAMLLAGAVAAFLILDFPGLQMPGRSSTAVAAKGRKKNAVLLEAGQTIQGVIRVDKRPHQTYRIRVPQKALLVDVSLSAAVDDLDLFLQYDQPIDAYELADYAAETALHNERIRVSRWDELPLEPGVYFLDVVWAGSYPPRVDNKRVREITFELSYKTVGLPEPVGLQAGKPQTGVTAQETGYANLFAVDVPQGSECLRIDLSHAVSTLDLYVSHGQPVMAPMEADFVVEGFEMAKSLIIGADSDPPLTSGRYYITVFDGFLSDASVEYQLQATFTPQVPIALSKIPQTPQPKTPRERMLYSTVELIVPGGGGSGTVISPGGLILTNHHVVENPKGRLTSAEKLIVAINADSAESTRDAYRGRVVASHKQRDLALVQITSGIYGQPLPDDLKLPFVSLADQPAAIGDDLWISGYPEIGGSFGRVSITVCRGIVAGIERVDDHVLIKTDADLHSGHSGGGAYNAQFQLIGVPSETIQESSVDAAGSVGFVRPLSLMPDDWKQRIEQALPN